MEKIDKVLNIAHRGASGVAPENTLASFQKAMELSCDLIELDVHQTKDGELVVLHSKKLSHLTSKGGLVEDFTLKEIKELDAGSWYSPEFADERIPTLSEVIGLTKGKVGLNIEIKKGRDFYPRIEEKIVKLLEKNDLIEPCIITSFHLSCLKRVKEINPYIAIGKVLVFSIFHPGEDIILDVNILQPHWLMISPWFVKAAHEDHLRVNVWTVNRPAQMERLIKMGVDGIITNYPERLAVVLNK